MVILATNTSVSVSFLHTTLLADRSDSLQKIEAAHEQTFAFIKSQIAARQAAAGAAVPVGGDDSQNAKDDICCRLVNASEAESEKRRLDSSELAGNVYAAFASHSK
jgi:hypothetical protein